MADLHIHSCLSPCASLRMSPRAIVDAVRSRGLDLIAITDHNTCAMGDIIGRVARERRLSFLYGIELQTQEEVHLLAYFNDAATCNAFAAEIYPYLPDIPNEPEHFGDQVIVDADETIIGFEPKLLLNSLSLSLEEVVERVERYGGLAVPAHADREGFGILFQLGFIPPGLDFPLIELDGEEVPPGCAGYPIIYSSDAHDIDAVGRRVTLFTVEKVSVEEMRLAARGVGGRAIKAISLKGESGEYR